jgi:hypothetical protein
MQQQPALPTLSFPAGTYVTQSQPNSNLYQIFQPNPQQQPRFVQPQPQIYYQNPQTPATAIYQYSPAYGPSHMQQQYIQPMYQAAQPPNAYQPNAVMMNSTANMIAAQQHLQQQQQHQQHQQQQQAQTRGGVQKDPNDKRAQAAAIASSITSTAGKKDMSLKNVHNC